MKIDSGREEFEFEANGAPRRATLGVVGALRAACGGEPPPKDRWQQLELLRQHVADRCAGLEITLDEADGLLAALFELEAAKKKPSFPATSPSSTTSTPSP